MENLRIPGPTPCPDEVLQAMARQMINHRGPEFRQILDGVTDKLKQLFQTKNDVLIFASSGTGAMEASVTNLLSAGDEALVISIVGKDVAEFAELAKKVEGQKGITALEAVLSCPHTPGYGTMVGQGTPESVKEITAAVKENCSLPVIIKLSPSVPGEVKAALAAEEGSRRLEDLSPDLEQQARPGVTGEDATLSRRRL